MCCYGDMDSAATTEPHTHTHVFRLLWGAYTRMHQNRIRKTSCDKTTCFGASVCDDSGRWVMSWAPREFVDDASSIATHLFRWSKCHSRVSMTSLYARPHETWTAFSTHNIAGALVLSPYLIDPRYYTICVHSDPTARNSMPNLPHWKLSSGVAVSSTETTRPYCVIMITATYIGLWGLPLRPWRYPSWCFSTSIETARNLTFARNCYIVV